MDVISLPLNSGYFFSTQEAISELFGREERIIMSNTRGRRKVQANQRMRAQDGSMKILSIKMKQPISRKRGISIAVTILMSDSFLLVLVILLSMKLSIIIFYHYIFNMSRKNSSTILVIYVSLKYT